MADVDLIGAVIDRGMDTGEEGGIDLASYWDYLVDSLKNPITSGPAAFIHAGYDMLYDNSHGSDRYWLSKIPIVSWNRKMRDAAKEAQDYYDNTGTDPQYINQIRGPGFESLYGGAMAGAGAVKMATSLSSMYTPEVVEDISSRFNHMYG